MARFLIKRLFYTIFVMFCVSIIAFALMRLAPGNPAELMLPDGATQEQVAAMEVKLGLDKPLIPQFLIYIGNLVKGDLGMSNAYGLPCADIIIQRLPATMIITVLSAIGILLISIPLGIMAGVNKGSFIDFFSILFALLGQSLSVVWICVLLILIFSVKLGWLPAMGYNGLDLKFLIMPIIAVGYKLCAIITRMARSGMVDVMSEDYITCAYAKGMSDFSVYTKYAFKNAMVPVVTVYGLQIASMLSGAVVIENTFSIPGIGSMLIKAVGLRDYPLVQSTLVVSAAMFAIINLIVDIVNALIDPRIQLN